MTTDRTQPGAHPSGRIIIADDHPLFRAALRRAVETVFPNAPIVEAENFETASALVREGDVELVCLDLHMSDSAGFSGLISLRHEFPAVPVVVVSASEAPDAPRRAVDFGASGFIPKSSSLDTICEALNGVADGDVWLPEGADEPADSDMARRLATLTPAQLRVLQGLNEGLLNKQIAYEMGISEATVKAHVTAIFRKLDVINRTQAVLAAKGLMVDAPNAG